MRRVHEETNVPISLGDPEGAPERAVDGADQRGLLRLRAFPTRLDHDVGHGGDCTGGAPDVHAAVDAHKPIRCHVPASRLA